MPKKIPITTNRFKQNKELDEARRQAEKLGLNTEFKFDKHGRILIDGKTAAEIDAQYEINMARFYLENGITRDGGSAPIPSPETMEKIKWIRPNFGRYNTKAARILKFKGK